MTGRYPPPSDPRLDPRMAGADEVLANADRVAPTCSGIWVLRLLLDVALRSGGTSWTVIRSRTGEHRVRRLVLRHMGDPIQGYGASWQGGREFHPTAAQAEVTDAPLPDRCPILEEADSLHIPVLRYQPPLGCDGHTHQLITGGAFARVQVSWWVHGPPEWQALDDWSRRLRTFLDDCLARDGRVIER